MKRRSMVVAGALAVVVVGGGAVAVANDGNAPTAAPSVEVARGDLVDKALAVGTIEPQVEVEVKSKLSGVVQRKFAEPGDYVKAGQPLLEVRPDPTPLELLESRRQVELRRNEYATARRELERQRELHAKQLAADQALDEASRRADEARIQLQTARERLALLERGRLTAADADIESVLRAPISGYVLESMVEIGDPVVPLTSYQAGTALMTMADMGDLIFRGTVDEIDVGRLKEGMPVEIKIGALPEAVVRGRLTRVSLKAQRDEATTATTFPIEVTLVETGGATLRAGFSANAEIIIRRKEQALQIPERLVTFEDDGAWVTVQLPTGATERRELETGLSDAINVEVVRGLEEGEKVLEKPAKEVG